MMILLQRIVLPYSLLLARHFVSYSLKRRPIIRPLLALLGVITAAVHTGRRLHKLGNEVDRNGENNGRVLLRRDGTESLQKTTKIVTFVLDQIVTVESW